MPLLPESNTAYWPLLLNDPLYILQQDLAQRAQTNTTAEPLQTATSAVVSSPEGESSNEATPPVLSTPPADLLWGSLDRGILILVEYPNHSLLERTDGLFLVDVLKALGLDFKEVATLNVCKCKTAADWAYVRQLSCTSILSFGVTASQLPYLQNALLYEAQHVENSLILSAEPLSIIREDVVRKKKLWNLVRQALV